MHKVGTDPGTPDVSQKYNKTIPGTPQHYSPFDSSTVDVRSMAKGKLDGRSGLRAFSARAP